MEQADRVAYRPFTFREDDKFIYIKATDGSEIQFRRKVTVGMILPNDMGEMIKMEHEVDFKDAVAELGEDYLDNLIHIFDTGEENGVAHKIEIGGMTL